MGINEEFGDTLATLYDMAEINPNGDGPTLFVEHGSEVFEIDGFRITKSRGGTPVLIIVASEVVATDYR